MKLIESIEYKIKQLKHSYEHPPICTEYVNQNGVSMQPEELKAYFQGAIVALTNVLNDLIDSQYR